MPRLRAAAVQVAAGSPAATAAARARRIARERQPEEEDERHQHRGVERAQPGPVDVPAPDRRAEPGAEPGLGRDAQRDERHRAAERELDQREPGGAAEVEVEAQRLVDRELDRGRPRPAAEGQRHRERGHAEQEHQHEGARQHLAQHRRLDAAEHVAGGEAELRRKPELLGRNGEPALQQQPRNQRHVEEDMREHHPAQPVDVEAGQRRAPRARR